MFVSKDFFKKYYYVFFLFAFCNSFFGTLFCSPSYAMDDLENKQSLIPPKKSPLYPALQEKAISFIELTPHSLDKDAKWRKLARLADSMSLIVKIPHKEAFNRFWLRDEEEGNILENILRLHYWEKYEVRSITNDDLQVINLQSTANWSLITLDLLSEYGKHSFIASIPDLGKYTANRLERSLLNYNPILMSTILENINVPKNQFLIKFDDCFSSDPIIFSHGFTAFNLERDLPILYHLVYYNSYIFTNSLSSNDLDLLSGSVN